MSFSTTLIKKIIGSFIREISLNLAQFKQNKNYIDIVEDGKENIALFLCPRSI